MDLQHTTKNNTSLLWPQKPVEVHTDVSEYGLGAALIQHSKPVAFASKTLTPIESRYANIECECLSVVFSLEKFCTYIYGNHVTVYNDHKPLDMMQEKPIQVAPLPSKNVTKTGKIWLYHSI